MFPDMDYAYNNSLFRYEQMTGPQQSRYQEWLLQCSYRTNMDKLRYTSGVGRDNSVGIATRYGLHGPGIESRWRRYFPHPSIPDLYNGYRVFPGGTADKRPVPSSDEVKENVELHLYFPFGPSWPFLGELYLYLYTNQDTMARTAY